MNRFTLKLSFLGLLAVTLAAAPLHAQQTNAAPKPKTVSRITRITPYRGKIAAIDKTEMTLTIGKETIQVTSQTRITKLGKPAVFEDGQIGDKVSGAYRKDDEGHLNALTLRFAPQITPPEAANSKTNAPNSPQSP